MSSGSGSSKNIFLKFFVNIKNFFALILKRQRKYYNYFCFKMLIRNQTIKVSSFLECKTTYAFYLHFKL